jgi:hypothetical protein
LTRKREQAYISESGLEYDSGKVLGVILPRDAQGLFMLMVIM